MKVLIIIILNLLLFSCKNSNGSLGNNKMLRFSENDRHKNLAQNPNSKIRVFLYEIQQVDVRDHHQSIFKEDSEVVFNLIGKDLVDPSSKGLEKIKVVYDKYGINKLEMGGDFQKGQKWELMFNENQELVKLKKK